MTTVQSIVANYRREGYDSKFVDLSGIESYGVLVIETDMGDEVRFDFVYSYLPNGLHMRNATFIQRDVLYISVADNEYIIRAIIESGIKKLWEAVNRYMQHCYDTKSKVAI